MKREMRTLDDLRPLAYGGLEGDIDIPDIPGDLGERGAVPLDGRIRTPGHGMPPRPEDQMFALQPFARLTRGQPLGKKEILAFDNAEPGEQASMTTILTIGGRDGDDLDACNMVVTLSQPRVLNRALVGGGLGDGNQQNLAGSYDNTNVGTGNFPGTIAPIKWVPITAIIEWGIGGTRNQAFVDYQQGAVINLSASWVRVFAAVAPDAENLDIEEGNQNTSAYYELAAFIGPGWAKPGVAQRTVFLGTIAPATESAVFAIPPFAKRATVISMDPIAGPPEVTAAWLRFWQGPTGVAGGGNVGNYFQSGNQPIAFDVPNAGAYFSVQSAMDGAVPFAVIFELAI
jgi:hypothetical protein